MIQFEHLIGRSHSQTCHEVVIGFPLINSELPASIFQAVHAHMPVEPQFIRSVLPLHLPVVARRRDSDAMVFYSHFDHCFFKQRLVL